MHDRRLPVWLLSALLLAACAQTPLAFNESASAPPAAAAASNPAPPMPDIDQFVTLAQIPANVAPPSGYVRVRDYVDSVKTPSGDQYQRVEYGWDYAKGVAVERRSTMDGGLIESAEQPALTLVPTQDEMMYAYHLVAIHPQLSKLVQRKDARLYGGFSLREPDDKYCNQASRCVHVMISGGDNGELALGHAIVDLMRKHVVYPFYDGALKPKS